MADIFLRIIFTCYFGVPKDFNPSWAGGASFSLLGATPGVLIMCCILFVCWCALQWSFCYFQNPPTSYFIVTSHLVCPFWVTLVYCFDIWILNLKDLVYYFGFEFWFVIYIHLFLGWIFVESFLSSVFNGSHRVFTLNYVLPFRHCIIVKTPTNT